MHQCAILLPAAGASQRMQGVDKLLQEVEGRTILRLIAERALQASARVAVTLPPDAPERARALDGLTVTRLVVPDATEGLAASLRKGASWAMQLPVQALMIVLPDMPEITADDMRKLIHLHASHPTEPLRACDAAQHPGHPTVLPHAMLPELLTLSGDTGARALLARHRPRLHRLPGRRAILDLDTPEAWADWRAQRS
ncbi:MAG: nucleotidyltransferase family protein [Rhodobacteraceae bacterium]|nr:MAG: nucleotidyltransferase family protein [Paracoccaceae bacterium]